MLACGEKKKISLWFTLWALSLPLRARCWLSFPFPFSLVLLLPFSFLSVGRQKFLSNFHGAIFLMTAPSFTIKFFPAFSPRLPPVTYPRVLYSRRLWVMILAAACVASLPRRSTSTDWCLRWGGRNLIFLAYGFLWLSHFPSTYIYFLIITNTLT